MAAAKLEVGKRRLWRDLNTGNTAEQACEYGLVDRIITNHELQRMATGFATRDSPASD